ncbi:hypothetical protein AWV63_27765 [Micromonospora rifamycinica]|nr:hypothetical protein AWV63_27765 [Micromonospora rifamycinica]
MSPGIRRHGPDAAGPVPAGAHRVRYRRTTRPAGVPAVTTPTAPAGRAVAAGRAGTAVAAGRAGTAVAAG